MGRKGERKRGREREPKDGARPASRASRSEKPEKSELREWLKSAVFAVVLFVVIRTFVLQTFVITSGSMENTLLVGDYLIVNRAAIGSRIPVLGIRIPGYSSPHRSDVLVFDPPHEQDLKLVKRLVGMPGDTIEMRDKVFYVDGVPLEEPYVQHLDPGGDERHPWMEWQREFLADPSVQAEYAPTRDNWGPLVIPEDRFFMLGDNRDTSLDSRYWGLLEGWRFEGRASRIYYSYDKQSVRPFPFIREVRASRIGDAIR